MRRYASLIAAMGLVACDGSSDDDGPPPPPPSGSWTVELDGADGAMLGVSSLGGDAGLISVGGPTVGDGPPSFFHRPPSATSWQAEAVPDDWRGAMWWTWVAAPDDIWVVGDNLQVARGAVGALERVEVQDAATATTATLFGVWGAGADDVWMVGGSVGRADGARGVLLRYDGVRVRRVNLTGTASVAHAHTLFKVWGTGPDDVMIVGSEGFAMHYNGRTFEIVDTRTRSRLLTVHGRSQFEMYAVGGVVSGEVLRWDGFGFRDISDPFMPPLNGVFAGPDDRVWVCGVSGYVAWREDGRWNEVETGVLKGFHGVMGLDGEGFAVGGLLSRGEGPRQGLIGRFGR